MANRFSVIHDGSMSRHWRKVGTKENPADDVSRGLSGLDMISSDDWRQGPVFLWQDEPAWPANSSEVPEVACDDQDAKKVGKQHVQSRYRTGTNRPNSWRTFLAGIV